MVSSQDGTPESCIDELNMMISIFGSWEREGLLDRFAPELVHWFISFLLYTILRLPEPTRSAIVSLVKKLWLAHFTPRELRSLALPVHDRRIVDLILGADDDGNLGVNDMLLTKELVTWRIAEYGLADLVSRIHHNPWRPR